MERGVHSRHQTLHNGCWKYQQGECWLKCYNNSLCRKKSALMRHWAGLIQLFYLHILQDLFIFRSRDCVTTDPASCAMLRTRKDLVKKPIRQLEQACLMMRAQFFSDQTIRSSWEKIGLLDLGIGEQTCVFNVLSLSLRTLHSIIIIRIRKQGFFVCFSLQNG